MTEDLFGDEFALAPLEIEDAEICFSRHVNLPATLDELLHAFINHTPWRAENITVWGKVYQQPRLVAWYGDAGRPYTYSGITLEPLPWTATLQSVREAIERITGETFNSVLLNLYRDHRDSMGFHSDDERELGPTPTIASLSLGATRTFVLKHKTRLDLRPVRIELPNGTLLVMKGPTQRYWKHGIDKQTTPCGPRVNLTFRRILDI